jgi:hypothetical protein
VTATIVDLTASRLRSLSFQCSTEADRAAYPEPDRVTLSRLAQQLRKAATLTLTDPDYLNVGLAWFDEGVNTLHAAILRRTVIRTTKESDHEQQ